MISKKKSVTLESFRVRYIDYSKLTMMSDSVRNVEYVFRGLMKPGAGFCPTTLLPTLNAEDLEMFLLNKFKSSKSAAALFYRVLRSALNKAVQWSLLDNNPLTDVKLPRIPKKRPAYITDEQFCLIMRNVDDASLRAFYLIAFNTGMRLSEILNLKWSNVDIDNRIIYIKCDNDFTTKSKADREVPMNDAVAWTLLNISTQATQTTYVFKRYHQSTVSHKFKKFVREAKLPEEIHFHSLRHSTASRLVQKGVSLYIVKEILGHSSYSTTQGYAHLNKDSVQDAINLLN